MSHRKHETSFAGPRLKEGPAHEVKLHQPESRKGEKKIQEEKKIIWVHTSGMRGKRWRGNDKPADEEEMEKYLQDRDVREDKNSLQAAD